MATKPVDFRKGHDGLAALVKNELDKDPFTGTVFVFRSRKADRLKLNLLGWQRSGDGLKAAGPRTIRSIVCGPRPASRPFRRGETAGRHRIDAAR